MSQRLRQSVRQCVNAVSWLVIIIIIIIAVAVTDLSILDIPLFRHPKHCIET